MAFTPLPPTQNQLSCQAQPKQDPEALQKWPFTKGSSFISERGHLRLAWCIFIYKSIVPNWRTALIPCNHNHRHEKAISNVTTWQSPRHPQTYIQRLTFECTKGPDVAAGCGLLSLAPQSQMLRQWEVGWVYFSKGVLQSEQTPAGTTPHRDTCKDRG